MRASRGCRWFHEDAQVDAIEALALDSLVDGVARARDARAVAGPRASLVSTAGCRQRTPLTAQGR